MKKNSSPMPVRGSVDKRHSSGYVPVIAMSLSRASVSEGISMANYNTKKRPGQLLPAFSVSQLLLTSLVRLLAQGFHQLDGIASEATGFQQGHQLGLGHRQFHGLE